MARRELDVYLDLEGESVLAGQVWFTQRRGGPISSVFAYTPSYLARPNALSIDPHLDLVTGNQYVDGLPGSFQDCAPDRWGRNLIDKRHRRSETSGRQPTLNDVDYLVEVSDRTRQGALRFTDVGSDDFLHPHAEVPKLIRLPRLLQASQQVDSSDDFAAVKDLLEAGSGSLGGARPKASVLGADGTLMIAKFPHREDSWDVMAWECVALDLAELAGIEVPERELVTVSDSQQVLLLGRFDRSSNEQRIPYVSAMTLLSAADGEWHDYVEVAEAITDVGSRVSADLAELYRRVAFSVAIHNTDDHLRNHGFLATLGGWALAPVFDVNPNPDANAVRVTGVAGATHRSEERDGLVALAASCRLTTEQADIIGSEVAEAVAQWRRVSTARNISKAEQDRFADVLDTKFFKRVL